MGTLESVFKMIGLNLDTIANLKKKFITRKLSLKIALNKKRTAFISF